MRQTKVDIPSSGSNATEDTEFAKYEILRETPRETERGTKWNSNRVSSGSPTSTAKSKK